jgi:type VI secretion system secreted protein VgrG
MAQLELSFESGEDSLSVRRFAVEESMSGLFSVSVWARSPNDDLDLESIVGKKASLHLSSGVRFTKGGARTFGGICNHLQLVHAESTGLSMYHLVIVPKLWLLGQRTNHRLFQHMSIPDVVKKLLGEWDIAHEMHVDGASHPKHELRTQYGESDLGFLHRMLEEAGISYFFKDAGGKGGESTLVLHDAPQSAEGRGGGPLRYVDNPNESAGHEFVTNVRMQQQVKPGKVTLRDHDFRRAPSFQLFGQKGAGHSLEDRLEQYRYVPGASLSTQEDQGGGAGSLVGDDKGASRYTEKVAGARANRALEAQRADRVQVAFDTNAVDIAPGTVLSMSNHPRKDLGSDKKLLITHAQIEGTHDGEWSTSAQAVSAGAPYRPQQVTPKPTIQGMQSAVVVGPSGEEIHTDELGRVRVQFHWDREGEYDDNSSCWMRVSQGWAGGGFGMIALPRVGQEVLVGFLEGDPDHPVVVGRLFNGTSRVPYDLPKHKTRSGIRTDSSPGSGGYNELMFEDAKGQELVYLQAERDLQQVVKHNEAISVGVNRHTTIGSVDESQVGERYKVTMKSQGGGGGSPTHLEMLDKKIVLSTGDASITLDGPNITLQAKGRIFIHSSGDDVEILGGPWVKINCGPSQGPSDTTTSHHVTGTVHDQDDKPLANQQVVIEASDGSLRQVTTDASGKYFALVPPGKVKVSIPGGYDYGQKGTNLDHMDGEHEEMDDNGPVR